ncbi:nuclear transport factor 2 family protein [uncultured Aquimarina sp.]|uniref:nuclear transport factor 2 family protein n=1 Tax=uncultured Aquimarina sp. TaxID=575652 RepID=UPI0026229070|nr:nuclear transport factor 2 family protein [uncultured Aquimarina sp.]
MKFSEIKNPQELSLNLKTTYSWYTTWNPKILTEDVHFEVLKNYPGGGIYKGRVSVMEQYLPALMSNFESWATEPEELFEIDGAVIGKGNYVGRTKDTENDFKVPFLHIWYIKNEQIYKVMAYTDTHHLQMNLPEIFNTPNGNLYVLKQWYNAALNGDGEKVAATLSDDINWHFALGIGAGGDYKGKDNLLNNVFPKFFSAFEYLQGYPKEFIVANNQFIVRGVYEGKTKIKQQDFTAEFTHIIEMENGKITSLHQHADSASYANALGQEANEEMDKMTKPFRGHE